VAKIAFIVGDDYEDAEFRRPYEALKESGHEIDVLGKKAGEKLGGKRGKDGVEVQASCAEREPSGYDLLVLPGGYGPDKLTGRSIRIWRRGSSSGAHRLVSTKPR